MSRIISLLLALVLLPGAAFAQAPTVEPGTRLSFPPTLGGATLTQSASRGGGSSYQYATPNGMEVIVDVYGGSRRAPNGSSHPTILNQFNDELSSLAQQAAASGLSSFEKPAVPSACTYGAYTFRCTTFSASGGNAGRISGKLLLIGYREHFLKIVINWAQRSGQTAADADKVLNTFVPALMPGR
ncbi:hypothetical protein [Reyranella sp.]|uniref:hypothetical protein n=1 Tax=Reyranella sp. TaxID=1929291 RepID=UPI003D13E2A9